MPRPKGFNPVSDAMASSHPYAEDDLYDKFFQCETIGDLHDLTFNAMHVEGRNRPIDWRRFERVLERLQEQATPEEGV